MNADDDEPGLGAPPPADPLAREVARAKIEAALFATNEPVKLGRYHLLEQVGAGGMGVVWGAYDPELDRKVAIKLVRVELDAKRRSMVIAEGKALAKLAHPNVVAVHDVGVVEDRVYIVMEWVRGENLREYVRTPRTLAAIVEAYRAAGEGLAAAHRAGLVHRDFKPDNAVIGEDGRVRVLDFGLARAGALEAGEGAGIAVGTQPTGIAGTPRYMAPEQAAGAALTPAVDQYAFCVALREAIGDGVPAWLDAILVRGTAREPAARFESMEPLLHALARDPSTLRRRRLLAGGGLVVGAAAIAVAFVVGKRQTEAAVAIEPCTGAASEIATAWNPARSASVASHVRGLGAYGAQAATRIASALDAYRDRWIVAHRSACLAHERRERTPARYERDLHCLERSRSALATAVEVVSTVDAARVPDAILAVRALPDAAACLETAAPTVPPPAAIAPDVRRLEGELATVRVRALAAEPAALAQLADLTARADQLGYRPLVAHAELAHGFALARSGKTAGALPLLERAAATALEVGDDVAFVEAYARQVYAFAVTPTEQRPRELRTDPIATLPFGEAVGVRVGEAGRFARLLLFNNAGIAAQAARDEARARQWFTRAYAEWQQHAVDSVELAFIPSNLALVTTEPAEQQRLLEAATSRMQELLGTGHPTALELAIRVAMATSDPAESARRLATACDELRQLHPQLEPRIVDCTYELGRLADERGDEAAARAAYAKLAIDQPTAAHSRQIRIASVRQAALDGVADAAARARVVARELAAAPEWWIRIYAADAHVAAALAEPRGQRQNDLAAALAILELPTPARTQTYFRRRLAHVQRLLADEVRD